jgi:putative nucleotidyltransferase with HDIG domain
MNESLRIFTQSITRIPTISPVANRIIDLIGNKAADVERIVETIERDPAISAKVLGVSNTAFFRMGNPVTNIRDAIMKIGFDNIKGISLGVALLTVFKAEKPERSAMYVQIFRHSLAVGFIAKDILEYENCGDDEDVFTSGLLHDLGLLVMHSFFPEISDKVLQKVSKGGKYIEAEEEVYGFIHSDVGAWLADKWTLPENINSAIYYHHNVAGAGTYMNTAAIVHIADNIAIKKGFGPILAGGFEFAVDDTAVRTIGMDKKNIAVIEKRADRVLDDIGDIFL